MDKIDHIAAFSKGGALFACVDDSGKLKIWETATNLMKQEFVPNLHLVSPITCIKWIEPESKHSRKSLHLALGTKKGKIGIYSYTRGAIDKYLTGHTNTVTDLFCGDADTLFSCGLDSKVIQWSFSAGTQKTVFNLGNEKPTALIVTGDCLVTASKQIKVRDLATHTVKKTLIGHQFSVNNLKCFVRNEQTFCISLSTQDRHVSVWNLDDESSDSFASFVTEDPAHHTSFLYHEDCTISAVIVTGSGLLHIFLQNMNKIKVPTIIKKRTDLQLVEEDGTTIPIVSAIIAKSVLIAYGTRSILRFETITPNCDVSETLLIRENPKKVIEPKESSGHNTVVPIVEARDVEYLNLVSSGRKMPKIVDQPLQARLDQMNLASAPDPRNMVKLLVQGLNSKDATILGMVFNVVDEKAISATLRRMSIKCVARLVDYLSSMMQKKTTHVSNAAVWLKVLFQVHTSQLMAIGNDHLKELLSVCLGIIDHRVNNFSALSTFGGRLDLVVSQLQQNEQVNGGGIREQNVLVYEGESDESDSKGNSDPESDAEEWSESESDHEDINEDDKKMDVSN